MGSYFDLNRINLGVDEAEKDTSLKEYFLKTDTYQNALVGKKAIIIGRKGSGKSAIFTLLNNELPDQSTVVITLTPDHLAWNALSDYRELGASNLQAYTNAWKLTLYGAIIWRFSEMGLLLEGSKLSEFYNVYLKKTYEPERSNWFINLIQRVTSITTPVGGVGLKAAKTPPTPMTISDQMRKKILIEWPGEKRIRILIDRLDDNWDASEKSRDLLIGLLKAANDINGELSGNCIITVFIRSDIYDILFFNDKDKLRQFEERIFWNEKELMAVVCERIKYSLKIEKMDTEKIWNTLFEDKPYRSQASSEKFVIDRTFKRPRDILSFTRYSLEEAIKNEHAQIQPHDVRVAEETVYSRSKYEDIIIEYQHQYPFIQSLMDKFLGCTHKFTKDELVDFLGEYLKKNSNVNKEPLELIKLLFNIGFIGIKRQGRAGVKQRGGAHFRYYYDDTSINPLAFNEYYVHLAFRLHLNISEKREKIGDKNIVDDIETDDQTVQ